MALGSGLLANLLGGLITQLEPLLIQALEQLLSKWLSGQLAGSSPIGITVGGTDGSGKAITELPISQREKMKILRGVVEKFKERHGLGRKAVPVLYTPPASPPASPVSPSGGAKTPAPASAKRPAS